MHIKKFIVGASASGLMLIGLVTPAFAGNKITVSGNGRLARTKINLSLSNSNNVDQNSTTTQTSTVNTTSNTGNNEIENNTISGKKKSGAAVVLNTGAVTTDVGISNEGGSNYLVTDPCGCQPDPDLSIAVTGNGNKSKTKINITATNSTSTNQVTTTTQTSTVNTTNNTGGNEIEGNTISGGLTKLKLATGGVYTGATIINTSGSNWIGPVFP